MFRCKTRAVSDTCLQAILKNEAYYSYAAVTKDERNVADERFPTDSQVKLYLPNVL